MLRSMILDAPGGRAVRVDRVALAHSGAVMVGWEAVSMRNEAGMYFGMLRIRAETHAPITEFRPAWGITAPPSSSPDCSSICVKGNWE